MPEPSNPSDAPATGPLILGSMLDHAPVSMPHDDWTGITDAKLRKKLQNRLNQRSRRNRIRTGTGAQTQALRSPQGVPREVSRAAAITVQNAPRKNSPLPVADDGSKHQSNRCELIPSARVSHEALSQYVALGVQAEARRLGMQTGSSPEEQYFQKQLLHLEAMAGRRPMGSPTSHLLLTLVQFNVFRAFIRNNISLGLPIEGLGDNDAISAVSSAGFNASGPPSLQPTQLQRSVAHHPWVDLLPFPAMRDNMLRNYEAWTEEDELCNDILGQCNAPGDRSGLIVWGESWDPAGWEVTEDFLKSWAWLLRGCWELVRSTNHFREQRGEEPLDVEAAVRGSAAANSDC